MTPRLAKLSRYGIGAVLFACAVVLPLLRQTGTRSWHTIWAEDGAIYFEEARRFGVFAVMFRGYAGYLQLAPRILGGASTLVPVRQLALYFALSAAVVNALLAWFVYWASAGWMASRIVRVALASTLVLLPALGRENTATITNTIWTFAAAAPWALVSLQVDLRAVVVRSVVAFLAATSTALAVIFLPLAIGCAVWRRSRATWLVVVSFCAGLAVQALVTLNTTDARTNTLVRVREASKLPELVSVRVFGQYALGDKGINAVWDHRRLLAISAPIVVLAVLALLLRGVDGAHQILAGSFVALAILTFVVPVWERGTNWFVFLTMADTVPSQPQNRGYLPAGRFSVVPVVMLASAVALSVEGIRRGSPGIATRICVGVFAAHLALVMTVGYSVVNARSLAPSWSANVQEAYRLQCLDANPAKWVAVPTGIGVYRYPVVLTCRELSS